MLAWFTEQQQAVCAVLLEDGGDRVLMPSSTEFAAIEELVKILKPFDDANDVLSGEAYPTLGIIQPVFHQFLNDVLVTKPGDKDVVKKSKMQSEKTCLQGIKIEVLKQCYLSPCTLTHDFKKDPCLQQRGKPLLSHIRNMSLKYLF